MDTLFTLHEAVTNYGLLRAHGVPTKMLWFCGGHGICLTKPGDTGRIQRDTLAWLARYLKGRKSVDTGPGFEWLDQNGRSYSAPRWPLPAGTAAGRRRLGHALAGRGRRLGSRAGPAGLAGRDPALDRRPVRGRQGRQRREREDLAAALHRRGGGRPAGDDHLHRHGSDERRARARPDRGRRQRQGAGQPDHAAAGDARRPSAQPQPAARDRGGHDEAQLALHAAAGRPEHDLQHASAGGSVQFTKVHVTLPTAKVAASGPGVRSARRLAQPHGQSELQPASDRDAGARPPRPGGAGPAGGARGHDGARGGRGPLVVRRRAHRRLPDRATAPERAAAARGGHAAGGGAAALARARPRRHPAARAERGAGRARPRADEHGRVRRADDLRRGVHLDPRLGPALGPVPERWSARSTWWWRAAGRFASSRPAVPRIPRRSHTRSSPSCRTTLASAPRSAASARSA